VKIINVTGARTNLMKTMPLIEELWDGHAAERIVGHLLGDRGYV
jgi:hypothetical protein